MTVAPSSASGPFTRGSMLSLKPEVLWSQVGSDTVLLDTSTGHYYGLGSVGSFILTRLDSGLSLGDIHAAMTATYAAAPEDIWRDLLDFAADLTQRGLVITTPAAEPAAGA